MASRAVASSRQRAGTPDWRSIFRRALRRAAELGGAAVLFGCMIFLALALASYNQTDPSASTAAGGTAQNWMGGSGAWLAERVLFLFGPVSLLLLPLLYVLARKLWLLAEEDEEGLPHSNQRWWMPIAKLAIAMVLLSTTLALAFDAPGGVLPASMGGISGLLGAKAVTGLAGLLGTIALPLFIALKLLLLAICITIGLIVRRQLVPLFPAIISLRQNGPTPETDRAIAAVIAVTQPTVMVLWGVVLLACLLGIATPV